MKWTYISENPTPVNCLETRIWVNLIFSILKRSPFTTAKKMDHQLLHQKVLQTISVMKTNTGVFVVFKKKCELKSQFSGNIECVCFHY